MGVFSGRGGPPCHTALGQLAPSPLLSSCLLLLTGGDSGDGASCVGSRAGISPWGHLPGAHPHPSNLLLDSGLSPHLGDGDTPQKGACSAPQTSRGACTLALAMGSVPWPPVELFL